MKEELIKIAGTIEGKNLYAVLDSIGRTMYMYWK